MAGKAMSPQATAKPKPKQKATAKATAAASSRQPPAAHPQRGGAAPANSSGPGAAQAAQVSVAATPKPGFSLHNFFRTSGHVAQSEATASTTPEETDLVAGATSGQPQPAAVTEEHGVGETTGEGHAGDATPEGSGAAQCQKDREVPLSSLVSDLDMEAAFRALPIVASVQDLYYNLEWPSVFWRVCRSS